MTDPNPSEADLKRILCEAALIQSNVTLVASVERQNDGRLAVRTVTVDEYVANYLYPNYPPKTGESK